MPALNRLSFLSLICLFLCLLSVPALGADAQDVTSQCTFNHSGKKLGHAENMLDRDYSTFVTVLAGRYLEIERGGNAIGGIYLQYEDRTVACRTEAFVSGSWQVVQDCGTYLTEYVALPPGTTRVRLNNTSRYRLFLNELYVYGPGSRPASCAQWHSGDKCDLMLIHCHPDDEVLWFGGLLPTYAGDRGYEVQVVCVVPATPVRRLELLDSLWHCGVTRYPHFLGLGDSHHASLFAQYKHWSKDQVLYSMTKAIRTYRPEVVVSHDLNGEYGHGAHMATADCTRIAVEYANNEKKFASKLKDYPLWEVQKLYLHLYGENTIEMDWHVPLGAFGGKDGITVATEAFAFHKSQQKAWSISDGGPYSNARFGLVMSKVGPDTEKNDFLENTSCVPHPRITEPNGPVEEEDAENAESDVIHITLTPES